MDEAAKAAYEGYCAAIKRRLPIHEATPWDQISERARGAWRAAAEAAIKVYADARRNHIAGRCVRCSGSGVRDYADGCHETCDGCDGTGYRKISD
jgi:excinuclease UvrABC ATPase subunit